MDTTKTLSCFWRCLFCYYLGFCTATFCGLPHLGCFAGDHEPPGTRTDCGLLCLHLWGCNVYSKNHTKVALPLVILLTALADASACCYESLMSHKSHSPPESNATLENGPWCIKLSIQHSLDMQPRVISYYFPSQQCWIGFYTVWSYRCGWLADMAASTPTASIDLFVDKCPVQWQKLSISCDSLAARLMAFSELQLLVTTLY